jgi:FkbM family methyltransferase
LEYLLLQHGHVILYFDLQRNWRQLVTKSTEDIILMDMLGMMFLTMGLQDKRGVASRLLEDLMMRATLAVAPQSIVEVGAHAAGFSIACKRKLPAIPVHAFEANPIVFNEHERRARAANVDYRNIAISDVRGPVSIRVPVNKGTYMKGMGSLLTDSATDEFVEYQVDAMRLDDVGARGAVLWIDVEGALGHVFRGGQETLRDAKLIFVEVEDAVRWPGQMLRNDVIRELSALGFRALLRDVQNHWQFNILFIREELIDRKILKFKADFLIELARKIQAPADVGSYPGHPLTPPAS